MKFERGKDPKEALQVGSNRRLKKGDKFILIVLAYKEHPEMQYIATAIEDEKSHKHWYVYDEKASRDPNIPNEMGWYEIRQVRWEIPETASGYAEMRDNSETPRWIYTQNLIDMDFE